MTKYAVFDEDRPASSKGFPELENKGWDNHIFNTFEDAEAYALIWLGRVLSPGKGVLKLNTKYVYDGYGDHIEIRSVGA